MYTVIDCETSGLFDFSKPADAEGQPRLASLAMVELDAELNHVCGCQVFVRPDGWTMTPAAQAVHGLTQEYLVENGDPIQSVLEAYVSLIDAGTIILAFNAQYDTKVMRGELRRAGIDDRFDRTPNICVMRPCTEICKIPGKRGYKFPKLHEACEHFGIELKNAHTAIDDALAAAEIARRLKAMGSLPEPAVHYAKNRPTKV